MSYPIGVLSAQDTLRAAHIWLNDVLNISYLKRVVYAVVMK